MISIRCKLNIPIKTAIPIPSKSRSLQFTSLHKKESSKIALNAKKYFISDCNEVALFTLNVVPFSVKMKGVLSHLMTLQ